MRQKSRQRRRQREKRRRARRHWVEEGDVGRVDERVEERQHRVLPGYAPARAALRRKVWHEGMIS